MSKPTHDRADASALLDDRGYSGLLIRGQNPALLFEKGVRERITESYYWKEQCFGLNAATLCDRAVELKFIGGTSGITGRPTPFLCLAFKMLQLVPEKEVVLEMLNFRGDDDEEEEEEEEEVEDVKKEEENGDAEEAKKEKKKRDLNAEGKLGTFKYLRCLAAFYIRLAWEPVEIYTTLEPLLTDYRKIKRRLKENFSLTYVDQFIDDLLNKDRICATSLWKMPSRANMEDLDLLEPRESPLDDEVDMLDEEDERARERAREEREGSAASDRSARSYRSRSYDSRSRSRSYDSRDRSRSRSRSYDSRDRRRSRSPGERSEGGRSTSRMRSRSRSRGRD